MPETNRSMAPRTKRLTTPIPNRPTTPTKLPGSPPGRASPAGHSPSSGCADGSATTSETRTRGGAVATVEVSGHGSRSFPSESSSRFDHRWWFDAASRRLETGVERRAQPDAVDQRDRPAGGEDEQDRGVGDVNEPEERETEPAGQEGDHLPDGDPIGNALEDRFSKRRHVQEAGTNAEYHDRPVLRRAGSPVSAWTNTAKAGRVSASVTNSPRRPSGNCQLPSSSRNHRNTGCVTSSQFDVSAVEDFHRVPEPGGFWQVLSSPV